MTISIQCESCHRTIKVKDEYAGRRIRCPGCKQGVQVPEQLDDLDELDDLDDLDASDTPVPQSTGARSGKKSGRRSKRGGDSSRPWYVGQWHWMVVLVVLLLSPIPTAGLVIAGLTALAGAGMALIGGIVPFLRIVAGDPGTVLSMLVSRSARFEMMDQPDNHPYKRLVRTAFEPTRGLFWRGVLLVVLFVPAAFVNSTAAEWFRRRGANAPPPMAGPQRFQDPKERPGGNAHPGFPPGFGGQNPAGVQPAADQDRLFYVTLRYGNFSGAQQTAMEQARPILEELPGYVADSVVINEDTRTIEFQHQGPIPPRNILPQLTQAGFNNINYRSSTSPPIKN